MRDKVKKASRHANPVRGGSTPGRRALAVLLSGAMALAPLTACAKGAGEEEMTRGLELTGDVIHVPESESGAYEVTVAEANLMEDPALAEAVPDIVTAEQAGVPEGEMARSADGWSLASVRREDVTVSYNALVTPAGGGEPQDETRQAQVNDVAAGSDGVKISFQGEGAPELTYTVRFAGTDSYAVVQVDPADNGVTIEGADLKAQQAELAEYKPGFEEKDIALPEGTRLEDGELVVAADAPEAVQEALLGSGSAESELSRGADGNSSDPEDGDDDNEIRNSDGGGNGINNEIGNGERPSGGSADGGERPSGGSADGGDNANNNANANAAGGDKSDANTGNATIEYMQKCKQTEWDYENYDAVARYVPEILAEIDPKAGQVAELGANAYRIARGFYRNEWSYIAEGGLGVLKMFGLFKGAGGGVSNEQILSEVQKVGVEVTELHALTRAMKAELNETLRQTYENSMQIFDSALNSLHANAEVVQNMLTAGAVRAAADGIEPPAEDCSPEQEYDYNYDLVEYIEKLEAAGGRKNSAFKGFTKHVENLASDFIKVTGEVGDPNRSGPVATYDKYWNLHFNYDTQGYYLRKSYRANIEYELKRAFGLLEIYYNVFDPETSGNYLSYNNDLWKALERLEGQDAGTSPEGELSHKGFDSRWFFPGPVRCNTFGKQIEAIRITYSASGNNVGTDALDEYVQRLHGRTVEDDLKLAGLWRDSWAWKKGDGSYTYSPHGLAFNGTYKNDTNKADIIAYGSGQIYKQQTTFANYSYFKVFDDDEKQFKLQYIWLCFKE